jgi:hypothetical protein
MLMIVVSRLDFDAAFRNVIGMVQPMGKLQKFIDATILKGLEPFVPFREGTLTRSGIINTVIGSGKIIYKTPYARKMYYGVSSLGNSINYNRSRHPLAQALWFEAYKSQNKTVLITMVQKKAKELE